MFLNPKDFPPLVPGEPLPAARAPSPELMAACRRRQGLETPPPSAYIHTGDLDEIARVTGLPREEILRRLAEQYTKAQEDADDGTR